MKKEEVYVNLQGKTKEELTDLYDFLKINNEPIFRTKERFLEYQGQNIILGFNNYWQSMLRIDDEKEVTIEQLKEILQPMENKGEQLRKEAKERGYTHDNFKCLIDKSSVGLEDINKWHYCKFFDTLYTNTQGNGGNVVYKEGEWAEFKDNTLEQQLQKAEAEVKRLQSLIEEENKPKVGDWVKGTNNVILKYQQWMIASSAWIKITDQGLINKLNELINN